MPSGKTHFKIEMATLLIAAGAGAGLNHHFRFVKWEDVTTLGLVFVGSYLFSSLMLSPDMDLARSDPQNRWGVLRVLWRPYAALFHHRGLSHNPIFGPLTRVAYLALIAVAVLAGLHYGLEVELKFLKHWWEDLRAIPLWAIGAGLFLPHELHILADKLFKN